MSEVLENLERNLREQVKCYTELYDLGKSKQKALIENSVQEIDKITAREEQLFPDVKRLEKERLLFTEQIGLELGQAPESLTLVVLAERFPVLQGVHSDLERVIGELQRIHDINTQLLQQSMGIVNFTLGLLMYQEKNTYTHPGRNGKDMDEKLHLLDWRI
ncbi:flagellar protein FlgN [Desulfosporosinus sp. FKA]|uniref:flagellar protein FlgN n=1 Tax=Desulfosporosinus sp. FKA TaxID=1969834 RepID=UPI000B4A3E48|nr:flagellar protein FlgN [Desulfosporosinus sp. FKA]